MSDPRSNSETTRAAAAEPETPPTPLPAEPAATAEPASPPAPLPAEPAAPAAPEGEVNLARRRFFRQFAGELIQTAATVAGAAQALQRASAEAAGAILDPARAAFETEPVAENGVTPDAAPTGFRTPFREDDGVLFVIDQRLLPDRLVEVEVRNGPEAATAIRQM
ncbi:MAG TPA: hypothetical protein VGO64_07280, partial [Candidatus Limnocylindrales bacterium]|nr:hypothetical protein [Candidatus Limnocylindrales bacterium]